MTYYIFWSAALFWSWLSHQKINILIRPIACDLIIYFKSSSVVGLEDSCPVSAHSARLPDSLQIGSWLSQQKIQFWSAPLFFGLDFLNKRYIFWFAPLRVCDFIKYFISQLFFGLDFLNKDTYFDPPRCVCELIIYFEARLFFGLDFSTKDTYFDPPRCVCAINIFLKSRSWLCQQKIYSDPPRLIISLFNHITALLRTWLSQQKIQYDPPRCVCN